MPRPSPIRSGDFAVSLHDGLTGQALVARQASLNGHSRFDYRRRAQIFEAGNHSDAAARADADRAAGVAQGGAGAARDVEDGFVRSGRVLALEARELDDS